MADAVASALACGEHLLVQAGTGTGKSLGYLVPALLHEGRVVIATATLALQHQLVERDIPALVEGAGEVLHRTPSYAVLKGRSNYACLHRVREGVPDEQGELISLPTGSLGAEVVELRQWVEDQASDGGSGDRDFAPRHTDRAWRQVSVSHRECLGASRCRFAGECFAERARDRAAGSQIVVTNHSILAIDAIQGVPMIPDYDVVVIDEAHELTARVTQASTEELSPGDVERAAQRCARHVDDDSASDLGDAADTLRSALGELDPGRIDASPEELADALALVRDGARALLSALPSGQDGDPDAALTQARGMVQAVFTTAERMAAAAPADVLWCSERDPGRGGRFLAVAPLEVWGQLRDRLFSRVTAVLTSATLRIGGDFDVLARSVGLWPDERHRPDDSEARAGESTPEAEPGEGSKEGEESEHRLPWRAIDVGSPFDYPKQAILYVAAHLPRPGRDGVGTELIDEVVDLVDAADGRTLGLFSSRRAAETAAEEVRRRLPHLTILAQGDAQLPELRRQFVDDPHTCLFGTLGLWQGLDVPGETCQLVIIDRIPFPRPDDPLMSARQRAAGPNGFMAVAATHAALLLAQGSGRLIRTAADRGVVAVLDQRLATAGYASFLRASLPPMWATTDRDVVLAALRRLHDGGASQAPASEES